MAKPTNKEIQEFAEIGKDVMTEGIQIFIRRDDALKLGLAVLGANIASYYIITKVLKKQWEKSQN